MQDLRATDRRVQDLRVTDPRAETDIPTELPVTIADRTAAFRGIAIRADKAVRRRTEEDVITAVRPDVPREDSIRTEEAWELADLRETDRADIADRV